ncbi:hypothetical protein CK934_09865 [Chitinophaga sp. MD30]|nr:hypothetical protein CK934_09865 [Chitinophaga sp. MD30]
MNSNINLYTGVPDIGIPIYTVPSKELSVPISLSYKATGVRLQDIASYVGMNWTLNAGGMITRIVRGLPDESEKGYIGKNKAGVEINDGAEHNSARADKIGKGDLDGEPDLFYVNTPSGKYSFVFDENGNAVFNRPTRIEVVMDVTNRGTDNLGIFFKVTDEKGVKYIFGANAAEREIAAVTDGSDPKPDFISTWYLSTMESFNGTDKIEFSYVAGSNIVTKIYNKVRIRYSTSGSCSGPGETISTSDNNRTYKAPKYISTIKSNTALVKFNYLTDRKDVSNGYQLYRIDIQSISDNIILKKYILNYEYFHPVNADIDLNRLCLKKIYVASGDGNASMRLYEFKYFNNPQLKFPSRSSVAYDHWGFYNNNSESTPFVPEADKQPDLDKTLQYSLQTIEHAQGGKTEFEFELNSCFDAATNMNKVIGGLRVKTMKEYDNLGNVYTRSYEYKQPSGISSGQLFMKAFNYSKTISLGVPSPGGICVISGESVNAGVLFNLADVNGTVVGYSNVKVTNGDGSYEISTFNNFNDFQDNFAITDRVGNTISADAIRQFSFPTSNAYKRGLLVNKAAYTASNQLVTSTAYRYGPLSAQQKKARGIGVTLFYRVGTGTNGWFENAYYQPTETYNLVSETERTYDQLNTALYQDREKTYEYNPDGSLLRKVTYNTSEGQQFFDKYYYPENRAELPNLSPEEIGAYTRMNLQSIPIREERHHADGSVDTKYTMFQLKLGGQPVVPKVFPVKAQSTRNTTPFTDEVIYAYDFETGNIITEAKRNGTLNGYLWDKNNALVAKSTQAAGNEIYFQSFEDMAGASIGNAYSGRKYFNGSFPIPFTKPNNKVYNLTYRRLISGKWEFVTRNYTDNYTINESYPIDDIRIAPVGTRMNTYTYIPLIGMNSACDENGDIKYYEYDHFQRLKVMRDLNGNILKQLEYKYAYDNPLPVLYARLEERNVIERSNTSLHYWKTGNIYVVLEDEAGNRVNNPGVTINYVLTESRNGNTTTTNQIAAFSDSEFRIYSGTLLEYDIDGNGTPFNYVNIMLNLAPGEGYKIR